MKNRERMLVHSRKDHFTHHLLTETGLSVNSTSILLIGIIFVRLSGCENDSVTFPAFISGSLQLTYSITMTFPIVASTPAREMLYTELPHNRSLTVCNKRQSIISLSPLVRVDLEQT